jgi:hypothetical protein
MNKGGTNMGVWAWLRPGDRVWKVVSDYEKGTIQVFDEKGNLIMEKKGLTKEAMTIVEKNFLDVTATNLEDSAQRTDGDDTGKKSSDENPMYA